MVLRVETKMADKAIKTETCMFHMTTKVMNLHTFILVISFHVEKKQKMKKIYLK
jgi:hypothetical protein